MSREPSLNGSFSKPAYAVMLRSYASLECDAFPQITQITAYRAFGTRRIP
jgi:hypothetical protein